MAEYVTSTVTKDGGNGKELTREKHDAQGHVTSVVPTANVSPDAPLKADIEFNGKLDDTKLAKIKADLEKAGIKGETVKLKTPELSAEDRQATLYKEGLDQVKAQRQQDVASSTVQIEGLMGKDLAHLAAGLGVVAKDKGLKDSPAAPPVEKKEARDSLPEPSKAKEQQIEQPSQGSPDPFTLEKQNLPSQGDRGTGKQL